MNIQIVLKWLAHFAYSQKKKKNCLECHLPKKKNPTRIRSKNMWDPLKPSITTKLRNLSKTNMVLNIFTYSISSCEIRSDNWKHTKDPNFLKIPMFLYLVWQFLWTHKIYHMLKVTRSQSQNISIHREKSHLRT